MNDMSTGEIGVGAVLAKLGSVKLLALAGAIAVALGFLVLWPKTAREGVSRIASTLAGSILGGKPLLAYVTTHYTWYPAVDGEMLVYVVAGLPAWWVLGVGVRSFNRYRGKDARAVIADFAEMRRKILGG